MSNRRVVVPLAALTRGVALSPELMRRLERAGLVVPVGKDGDGQLFVDVEARQKLERVTSLIGAGYAERDIALIVGKVEPSSERTRVEAVCDARVLAAWAGVGEDAVRAWASSDLLPVWAVREDGEPLFLSAAAELAGTLAAAELLGLGAHKGLLAQVAAGDGRRLSDDAAAVGALMKERLSAVEQALRILKKAHAQIEASARPATRKRLLSRRKASTTRAGVPRAKGQT